MAKSVDDFKKAFTGKASPDLVSQRDQQVTAALKDFKQTVDTVEIDPATAKEFKKQLVGLIQRYDKVKKSKRPVKELLTELDGIRRDVKSKINEVTQSVVEWVREQASKAAETTNDVADEERGWWGPEDLEHPLNRGGEYPTGVEIKEEPIYPTGLEIEHEPKYATGLDIEEEPNLGMWYDPETDTIHGGGGGGGGRLMEELTSSSQNPEEEEWLATYDPAVGAVKWSGKAVFAEVNGDSPYGKYQGSVGKAEGELVLGYDYDPEAQVEFYGQKVKGSVSLAEGKWEGKYGKLEGRLYGAGIESKTGVEYDEKTGKWFVGTSNKASAGVAEASGELKTADDSFKLVGEAQFLRAEATLDANAVVDEYGIDISGKAGAEANLYKVGVGGEMRMTPKALFDNTLGDVLGVDAPDYLDFGPVIGAKVSEGKGVGGTLEGGTRLGVDEVNARAGGFIELGEGVGLDVKTGMRLGPLKYAYDNWDEISQDAEDLYNQATEMFDGVDVRTGPTAEPGAAEWVADAITQAATVTTPPYGEAVEAVSDWFSSESEDVPAEHIDNTPATDDPAVYSSTKEVTEYPGTSATTSEVTEYPGTSATTSEVTEYPGTSATTSEVTEYPGTSATTTEVTEYPAVSATTTEQSSDVGSWVANKASETWDSLWE